MLLLVQNHTGYLNLCQLLTKASLQNQVHGRAEVHPSWFVKVPGKNSGDSKKAEQSLADGLVALSGAHLGDVGSALLAGNLEQAKKLARIGKAYLAAGILLSCSAVVMRKTSLMFSWDVS
jgi:DNA polymerase-3 subunit alpha